ncbi:MAG: His-rich protein BRANT [Xanthobacteraceae bacterium]
MIKTLSAALLAVSMLAVPAMAAGPSHAPAKSVAVSGSHISGKVLNAQARMHKHRTVRHHHHLRGKHAHKPVVMHRGHRH